MSGYMLNDESLGLVHTYSSYDDRVLKIRNVKSLINNKNCVYCENVIHPGESATYYAGLSARQFYTYYVCKKCEKGEN